MGEYHRAQQKKSLTLSIRGTYQVGLPKVNRMMPNDRESDIANKKKKHGGQFIKFIIAFGGRPEGNYCLPRWKVSERAGQKTRPPASKNQIPGGILLGEGGGSKNQG